MKAFIILITIPAILYSIILHEISHGFAAYLLGDRTAKNLGRLSLNPIRHIDPFGTILLPILLLLTMGLALGYAKPVPINPRYFKHAERGMMITGAAGPLSNIIIGGVLGLLVKIGLVTGLANAILFNIIYINFFLALLNLLPIPPLDGSRILAYFLPSNLKYSYYQLEKFGILVLLLLVFFAQNQVFAIFDLILSPVLGFFGF